MNVNIFSFQLLFVAYLIATERYIYASIIYSSSLAQKKDCRLLGAEPLSEPVLINCQVDPREQTIYNGFHEM